MNSAVFVYYYRATNTAVAKIYRDDVCGVLLFTCPLDWCPKDKAQFLQAAKFYDVPEAHRMTFVDDSEDIPF